MSLESNLKEAIELLKEDRKRNVNLINFIKNNFINSVDIVGKSLLVRGESDENWVYISSESEDEIKVLINKLNDNDKCFAVIEDWMIPL